MTESIDANRLTLMLNDLRLPAIKQDWSGFAARADKESWPASRFLATLAEHEIAERDRRRLARHLAEAQLLPGKTLDRFDFDAVPVISKAHVLAICAGDSWIDHVLPHEAMLPSPGPLPQLFAPDALVIASPRTPIASFGIPVAASSRPPSSTSDVPNTIRWAASRRQCFTRRCKVRSNLSG